MNSIQKFIHVLNEQFKDDIDKTSDEMVIVDINENLPLIGEKPDKKFEDQVIWIPVNEKRAKKHVRVFHGKGTNDVFQIKSGLRMKKVVADESGEDYKKYVTSNWTNLM